MATGGGTMTDNFGYARRVLVALAIVSGAFVANAAHAESVSATLTKWGLIGEWAVDCKVAPGDGLASRQKYVAQQDGSAFLDRNFGDLRDHNRITTASLTKDGWLEIKVIYKNLEKDQANRILVYRKLSDRTLRAMSNQTASGQYSIKDGKFTANGKEAPIQHRCN